MVWRHRRIENKTGIGENDGRQPGIGEQFDGRDGSGTADDQRDANRHYEKYCRQSATDGGDAA